MLEFLLVIAKNIRYLLWNRGAWRFFHDTYLTIEVQGIWCTHHLHDSCPLTDVNQYFTAPGCRYYFKINSWWPIVTPSTHGPAASYCDVTWIVWWCHCPRATHTARRMVLQWWVESRNYPNDKFISYTSWFNIFVYFVFIFGPLCFNTGHR